MTIEEFINATIPTTQPNEYGVYLNEISAEIVDDKNKQLTIFDIL